MTRIYVYIHIHTELLCYILHVYILCRYVRTCRASKIGEVLQVGASNGLEDKAISSV